MKEDRIKSEYMLRAVELAKRGTGYVAPNPLVGAVIVRDGQVIGEGWHAKYGDLHAERNALKNCADATNADLYVTLEPCCHHGKQPPCTKAVMEAGIRRVIVGSNDPNPLVAGKGIAELRQHGIEVITEFEKAACDALNPAFFHYMKTKRPYVVMKYAMTMDGKIATRTGASKWITGASARKRVHEDRHRYTGIMVGIGTVLADDPMLNCRIEGGRDPIRIICDSHLRTPLESQVVQTAGEIPTMIATTVRDDQRQQAYVDAGCQILEVPEVQGHLSLVTLVKELGAQGIDSILLEGGGTLNYSALESGIVNHIQTYIAPKIFGGEVAKTPVQGKGVELPEHAFFLENTHYTQVGEDLLVESDVRYPDQTEAVTPEVGT